MGGLGVREAPRGDAVIVLSPGSIRSVAVIGAHCDDIAIGAGATLLQLTQTYPDVVVHALVMTGAGTDREIEEKNAFAAMCGKAETRLTVHDLPDGRLPRHWGDVKGHLADFRSRCEPDLVIGPQRGSRLICDKIRGSDLCFDNHGAWANQAKVSLRGSLGNNYGAQKLRLPRDVA